MNATRYPPLLPKEGISRAKPLASLHSMWHTHASQLRSRGVLIQTVSKRLGHANPSIALRIYAHALESDELIAAKRWDDGFADILKVQTTSDIRH